MILAFVTAIIGVFAFQAFAAWQTTQAPTLFMIGLMGTAILVAIDQSRKPKAD